MQPFKTLRFQFLINFFKIYNLEYFIGFKHNYLGVFFLLQLFRCFKNGKQVIFQLPGN